MTQLSMFEKQLEKIYEINDFLPKLSVLVDFEAFHSLIDQARRKTATQSTKKALR
jgi:hypothetical protein